MKSHQLVHRRTHKLPYPLLVAEVREGLNFLRLWRPKMVSQTVRGRAGVTARPCTIEICKLGIVRHGVRVGERKREASPASDNLKPVCFVTSSNCIGQE